MGRNLDNYFNDSVHRLYLDSPLCKCQLKENEVDPLVPIHNTSNDRFASFNAYFHMHRKIR